MYEHRQVKVLNGSQVEEYIVELSMTVPWTLRFLRELGGDVEYSCERSDLFECLTSLRREYLEKKNLMILCNGARADVYPSRMSRQMSGGKKAYIMKLGESAKKIALVDIFDEVDDFTSVGTVAEQEDFKTKWLESLQN